MHYHCTELMLIVSHWKEWYDIIPRQWLFLEAGEAKTAIDSHHAQVIKASLDFANLKGIGITKINTILAII
jgi:hypothetical protein